jgi:hypothetical protein
MTTTKTTTKKQADSNDNVVRDYLNFLGDPLSVLDEKAIKAAQKALDAETDVLKKLRLNSTLSGLKSVDTVGDSLENAFVDIAKQWASDNKVTSSDFIELYSVPRTVLIQAGFTIKRAERVLGSVVEAAIRDAGEIFTIPSITDQTGSTYQTVTKTVRNLVKAGTVEVVDAPKDTITTGGRQRVHYQMVSS